MRTALASRVVDDVLNKLRMKYKLRADTLSCALNAERRIQIVNQPVGGYFVWIKFPDSVNAENFLEFCNERVKFMLGVRCDIAANSKGLEEETDGGLFASHARLCFADLDEDALETGIAELIACFREYIQSLSSNELLIASDTVRT